MGHPGGLLLLPLLLPLLQLQLLPLLLLEQQRVL
jgi:hypothetical protein